MEGLHVAQIGEWFHNEETFDFLSDQNMHEYDFIIIDTETLIKSLKKGFSSTIDKRMAELKEFIVKKDIPVVFLFFLGGSFPSRIGDKRSTISDLLGLDVEEESSTGRKIEVNPDSLFSDFLKRYATVIEYKASFSKHPGISIGKAKSKSNSVGFYTRDFVFLPGLSEDDYVDDEAFLRELYDLCRIVRKGDDAMQVPEWANNYFLPGEKEEKEKADAIELEIAKLQQAKVETEQRLSNFLPLKQLWTASGSTLENAVRQVFIELGFKMLPAEDRRDDIIMEYNDQVIVVEVKGQNKSAAEKNAAQLEKWVSTYMTNHDGVSPKGLLIVNTFREQPLEKRTEASFPNQMLSYSVNRNHCLLTTLQLCSLLLFCRTNPEEKEAAIEKLLTTIGCFGEFDNWQDFILMGKKQPVKRVKKKSS